MKTIFIDIKNTLVDFDVEEICGQVEFRKKSFKYFAKLLKKFNSDFDDIMVVFLNRDEYGEEIIKKCMDIINDYLRGFYSYQVYWKNFNNNKLNNFIKDKNSNPLLSFTDNYVIISADFKNLKFVYFKNKDFLKHFIYCDSFYGFTKDQYKQAENILKGKIDYGKIWKF